ncbi:MAG: hypothetical protein C7B43_16685 [Sulfobacillus benefaciens]|uniref:Antitoxin SocA-like Panacea domain-containing protein n=1 Tax=Sulfobacillus benefaciens TaxID=453960 RepID=A0A2T2WTL5_9FIRM|nr:MAG: hypothetical protein C7B43_16685 [Sulfobacillus benefaciens]
MAGLEKLRELLLYLAFQGESDPHCGTLKLDKLLFAIDFSAYLAWRAPITEAEYIALEWGPVPRQFPFLLAEMIQRHDATMRWPSLFDVMNPQERLMALRKPHLEIFTGPEIALIDAVIESAMPYNGRALTEWSYRFNGWKAAKKGEAIPYESALISSEPPTSYEIQRTQELIQEHGW